MIRGSNNAYATPITTNTAFRPWHADTVLSLNLLKVLGDQATVQGSLSYDTYIIFLQVFLGQMLCETGTPSAWIGLSDLHQDNEFRWIDGTAVEST